MDSRVLVPLLALLLQAASLVFAARLLRHSDRRLVAIVLFATIFLVVVHLSFDLYHYLSREATRIDLFAETIGLTISCLTLFGIGYITRLIASEEQTRNEAEAAAARYRVFFEQSPDGVLLLDSNGAIVEFNDQTCRQLGYSPEEFRKMRIQDIDAVESPEEIAERLRRVREEGRSDFEVKHRTKSGEVRDVQVIVRTVELSGKIFHHAIWRDITESKNAEHQLKRNELALRESEERFRDVVAAAGEYVWEIDDTGRLTYLSDRVETTTGYSVAELLGRTQLELSPPDEAARLRSVLTEVFQRKACIPGLEQKIVRKDGDERYLRVTGIPIVRDGAFLGYRGTSLDITEQRRTADELDRYRHSLEENVMHRTHELQATVERLVQEIDERAAIEEDLKTNRVFLNNILNSIQDPIMVLDRSLHILMVNTAFERAFLRGEGIKFLEGTCHEVFYGLPRSCPNCLSKTAMSTGQMAVRTICHGEGAAQRWFEISAFPLSTSEGRLIGSVHHMRDISGRRAAEEQIEKYQERLRTFAHQLISTEERERRRIAQALHDGFPQKLALSKMLLQEMQSGLRADESAAATLARVYELYDGMTQEVRALTFELSPPILYEVGLEPALERLLENMLSGSPIDWEFENWRSGGPIRGELATILYAMLRELVMNVVKYADARYLKVTLAEWADVILVVVQDDGKGMPQGAARHEIRAKEMRGFGLFSVRERLRHLNGRLMIDTGPGKGTIIRIEVPWKSGAALRGERLPAALGSKEDVLE